LFVPLALSMFIVLFGIPFWIKKAKQVGLVWEDMHKVGKPKNVAGSGGIIVLFGFVIGALTYIFIQTFYLKNSGNQIEIFALITSILIVGLMGFVDDILGWKRGGLSERSRIIMLIFVAIPLIVINAGESTMMGIEFGLFYPLLLIPLGVIGVTSTFNFLAGYNGLETSQGIILISALSFVAFKTGNAWLSVVGLCMIGALLAFWIYNKVPAHVFPGDALTYPVGALFAVMTILGNMEKIAVFFFIPYIIEVGLKSRGKLKKQSFGKLNDDGTLDMPYSKIYGLEHLAIYLLKKIKKEGKVYERDVVLLINAFQIFIVIIGFLLFL